MRDHNQEVEQNQASAKVGKLLLRALRIEAKVPPCGGFLGQDEQWSIHNGAESPVKSSLRVRMFQIGAAPKRGEGLRIGTTRRPPHGVRRSRWQRDGYFD